MSVLLESGAWSPRDLALVEAGFLVYLYSALMWVNIGVRLDIVLTLKIPIRKEISFTFCISPHVLGGYGGNRWGDISDSEL